MNSETTMTAGFLVLIVGLLINVYNFLKAYKGDKNAENFIKVNMKLDEICNRTSDIKSDMNDVTKEVKTIREAQIVHDQQIATTKEDVSSLWKRVDSIAAKVEALANKN